MIAVLNASPRFLTTRWSVVLNAGGESHEGQQALATLAETYWYPLYAYLRRRGVAAEEAADLVQGLFARLLERDAFRDLAPERGRFRSYLQACLRHLVADTHARNGAVRRGGGRAVLSLDAMDAQLRYANEPTSGETPERIYHRQWARTVLERALQRLERDCAERGQADLFRELASRLGGAGEVEPLSGVAARLDMTENALKVALHRLRQRFGALLRAEVAGTVEHPGDLEQEIRDLRDALAEGPA